MREINCNICGADKTSFLFQKDGYNIVQCVSCGLAYINPQPEDVDLRDYYQENYGRLYIESERKIKSKFGDGRRELRRLKGLR